MRRRSCYYCYNRSCAREITRSSYEQGNVLVRAKCVENSQRYLGTFNGR